MKNNSIKLMMMLLCISSIISCKKKQNNVEVDSYKTIINNSLGKKLFIPDSLELYTHSPSSITRKEIFNSELKIYSHIDASCGTCIESLKTWDRAIPEFNKKNVQVILICTSNNKFELLKYFFESKEIKGFSHPLFLDYKNDFKEKNKFMAESKNFETVLTDKDDNILLIGNPNFLAKIKELYFKEIEKHKIK